MCLGALVHAGVPLEYLIEQLGRLGLANEYQLSATLVQRNGQQATKVNVELSQLDGSVAKPNHSHPQHSHDAVQPNHEHHEHGHSHPYSHEHSHEHSHGHQHSHKHEHTHQHSPVGHSQITAQTASQAIVAPPNTESLHQHHSHHSHSHSRHLPEIEQLILAAQLPQQVTHWSLAIFRRLAEAEGAVHGISPEAVHFHEVGATDAIVDIVGTCLGLDWLGIEQIYCSAMPVGGGTVWAAHGRLPVPPPAVLKLWEMRQVPLYSNGINKELVTPTGAAIVTILATQFGAPPPMILQKVGLGAGSKDLPIPNILRLWIGEAEATSLNQNSAHDLSQFAQQPSKLEANSLNPSQLITDSSAIASTAHSSTQETVTVLETQIDDLNPQAVGYVMTQLLSAGALDVFTQAIGMKKSRPGILLTVICRPEQAAICEAIMFQETTTLGIRHYQQQRTILERMLETVRTSYGSVRVKVARLPKGTIVNVQPEYEDCVQLAQAHQLPWREVHRLALQAWHDQ